ncbi:hypothetical protein [Kitasatospora purpeofusca]|uniref:hypothetical protein n=1 Tax=Kitasatospora purpeofusca TaxID=67352 RepID=UPI003F4AA8AC
MEAVSQRLRLAADLLNEEVARFDPERLVSRLLVSLGIAGDTGTVPGVPGRGESPARDTGGHLAHATGGHDGDGLQRFCMEREALLSKREEEWSAGELRRIAELTELLVSEQEAGHWWLKSAEAGDEIAAMMVAELGLN